MTFDPTNKTDLELRQRADFIDTLTLSPAKRVTKVQELLSTLNSDNISQYDITCFCAYWLMSNFMKDKHIVYHSLQNVLTALHQWHYFECPDWEHPVKFDENGVKLVEPEKVED